MRRQQHTQATTAYIHNWATKSLCIATADGLLSMHFGIFQDVRNQGRLAAEAEQHGRDMTERNRFMRRIAAQSGVMQLPGLLQSSPVATKSAA